MYAFVLLVTGCQTLDHIEQDSIAELEATLDESIQQNESRATKDELLLPDAVVMDLLPPMPLSVSPKEERFDIAVNAMPAQEFFVGLVEGTEHNVVVHPDVKGEITFTLKQVTLDEALDAVRDTYGFDYEETKYGYRVLPSAMRTEMFHLNYLNVSRKGSSETRVSSGQITGSSESSGGDDSSSSSGSTQTTSTQISTSIEANYWAELKSTIELIVDVNSTDDGGKRKVIVNPQSGIIIVQALPNELHDVKNFLEKSELILQRQVLLEAKILEVQLSDEFQAGIDWAAIGEVSTDKTIAVDVFGENLANSSTFNNFSVDGVISLSFSLNDFAGAIELLQTQGNVQVLSSPRISTVNNQQAVIKVGTDEYFVTEFETTTTTGDNPVTSPTVELTPFFSGIALDVTPQIGEDDVVILHVHPSISQVDDQIKTIQLGSDIFSLPLALSTIRESDSIIKAHSGEIVVIGGLLQHNREGTDSSLPGFEGLPVVGSLFEQKRQRRVKSELVILLRPIVMDHDAKWNDDIKRSRDRVKNIRSDFY